MSEAELYLPVEDLQGELAEAYDSALALANCAKEAMDRQAPSLPNTGIGKQAMNNWYANGGRSDEDKGDEESRLYAALNRAAAETKKEPSRDQINAGNYRKGKFAWKGLTISLENPAGSTRTGVGRDGTAWSTKMQDHYGYFLRTESEADGDHIDVFVSDAYLDSELVFVVNQVDPDNGRFDEAKCIVGNVREAAARATYLRNYAKGWQGLGSIVAMTLPQFKTWLIKGDTSKPVPP